MPSSPRRQRSLPTSIVTFSSRMAASPLDSSPLPPARRQPNSAELVDSRQAATGALYSPFQVGLAAFLGGPFASCWLLAANYAALGKPSARRNAWLWGIGSTAVLVAVSLFLPVKFPRAIIPIAYTVTLAQIAHTYQGEAFDAHLAAGGPRRSTPRLLGFALPPAFVLLARGVRLSRLLSAKLP